MDLSNEPSEKEPLSRTLHSRFQVEIQRLGQIVRMDVTTYAVTDRKGSRLEAETQVQDPFHNRVVFHVRNAADFGQIKNKLQAQLIHRGYAPLRMRLLSEDPRTGATKWLDWEAIEGGVEAIRKMIEDSLPAPS